MAHDEPSSVQPMAENGTSDNMVRVRLDDAETREKWKAMLNDRQISQQRALVGLIEWIIRQEPLTQAMIFKQVPKTDFAELSRIVLRRLGDEAKPKLGLKKKGE